MRWRLLSTSLYLGLALSLPNVLGQQPDIVQTAVKGEKFKTLVAAVQAAGLVEALSGPGPFTVFAPTDEAFAKLPPGTVETLLKPENKSKLAAVLTYHVVPGRVLAADVVKLRGAKTLNGQRVDISADNRGVKIDNAQVVTTDLQCSNGVIHVIDAVILPASDDIPTTATKADMFKTLLAAVKAAGLAETLAGEGPFTVFAPTDEAFAKLPPGTVENLLKPENRAKLVSILKYHVVAGRIYSEDAVKAGKATTLQGSDVRISIGPEGPQVNSAKLRSTDLDASNGVIHVVDSVLMPTGNSAGIKERLQHTVANGAALFNAGQHQACAELYYQTLTQLMQTEVGSLQPCAVQRLSSVVQRASMESNPTQKAWMLRHEIDRLYGQLN